MKKMNLKKKKSIFIFIIIFALINIILFLYVFTKLSGKILEYSKSYINVKSDKTFKNAIKKVDINEKEDLIILIRNDNNEILTVDFDVKKTNKLMQKVTYEIDKELDDINKKGYKIYVPLGIISDSSILSNMGPRIPVKINIIGSSIGNVRTKVKEYGINNVLLEIYIEVRLTLEYNLAFKKSTSKYEYKSLIASKIINGKIPDYYDTIEKSAFRTINIPIK